MWFNNTVDVTFLDFSIANRQSTIDNRQLPIVNRQSSIVNRQLSIESAKGGG